MIGALVVAGLLGAGGLIWLTGTGKNLLQSVHTDTAQDVSAIVASIHGGQTTITRGQLDEQIHALAQNPQIQVPDASQKEERTKFEHLVVDQMVRDRILFDEAQKQGFTADDTAIDAQLTTITEQYKDTAAFEQALAAAQLDRDALRENIRHQLVVDQYYKKITAEQTIAPTPEEIRAFYDQQIVPQQTASTTIAFETVADQIKTHLEQQKTQEVINGIVDGLYASAEVTILI